MGRKGGWYGDSARHSQARKTGSAGGNRTGKSNLNQIQPDDVIDKTGWQARAAAAAKHAEDMAELARKDLAKDKRRGIKRPPGSGYRGGAPTPTESDYPHRRRHK